MQYGTSKWADWVLDEDAALEHIKAAYEAGIQTFDTANVYSYGESERILGKVIKKLNLPRDEIVILTKLHGVVAREFGVSYWGEGNKADSDGYVNQHGLSRKHIFESVKHSLERLQLDYVDVLQYAAILDYAINNKLTPFISMQNHYSLLYREEEREMFPTLKLFGVGSIPWSPIARGVLTRPFGETTKRMNSDLATGRYLKMQSTPEILKRVEEVSKKLGISMAQVSVAWILSKEGVSAPIVGTTSLKNLEEIIAAVDVKLTEEDIKYLEEPYVPQEIFGHF
uniref:NADP-dependent oxidoreductase domain-containing protein n=1 Tax=Psilocybe cubensis TaxID=181762 RepID=A0A8H7XNR5_PSICU